jgi:hypothetical protein
MITKEDIEVFESNKYLYEMLIKHSFVRNYTKETYSELIRLYTKYVSDRHNFSHWCSSCRAELVNHLYNWYINNSQTEPIQVLEVQKDEESLEQQIQAYKKKKKK